MTNVSPVYFASSVVVRATSIAWRALERDGP